MHINANRKNKIIKNVIAEVYLYIYIYIYIYKAEINAERKRKKRKEKKRKEKKRKEKKRKEKKRELCIASSFHLLGNVGVFWLIYRKIHRGQQFSATNHTRTTHSRSCSLLFMRVTEEINQTDRVRDTLSDRQITAGQKGPHSVLNLNTLPCLIRDYEKKFLAFLHRFIRFLLSGVFGCFDRVGADLHVHGIDDVIEVLHHSDPLERGVLRPRAPVHTLKSHKEVDLFHIIKQCHTSKNYVILHYTIVLS